MAGMGLLQAGPCLPGGEGLLQLLVPGGLELLQVPQPGGGGGQQKSQGSGVQEPSACPLLAGAQRAGLSMPELSAGGWINVSLFKLALD